MHVTRITDLDHEALADYNRLTDVALRRVSEPEGGLYIAESTKVIERALRAGHVPRSVLMTDRWLPDIEPLVADHEGEIFVGDVRQHGALHRRQGTAVHAEARELLEQGVRADEHRAVVVGDERQDAVEPLLLHQDAAGHVTGAHRPLDDGVRLGDVQPALDLGDPAECDVRQPGEVVEAGVVEGVDADGVHGARFGVERVGSDRDGRLLRVP